MEKVLLCVELVAPIISLIALVIHMIVAHRLKCEKSTLDCLREDLPALLENFFKKGEEMYKTLEQRNSDTYAQSFTEHTPEYVLNPATNELEKLKGVGTNDQQKIDSYYKTCLDMILGRLMESSELYKKSVEEKATEDYTQSVSDLSALGEALEVAEEYRERFKLPENYSMADIYDFVDKHSMELKETLSKLQNKIKEDKDNGS